MEVVYLFIFFIYLFFNSLDKQVFLPEKQKFVYLSCAKMQFFIICQRLTCNLHLPQRGIQIPWTHQQLRLNLRAGKMIFH